MLRRFHSSGRSGVVLRHFEAMKATKAMGAKKTMKAMKATKASNPLRLKSMKTKKKMKAMGANKTIKEKIRESRELAILYSLNLCENYMRLREFVGWGKGS